MSGAIVFDEPCHELTQRHSCLPCTHWNAIGEGWHSVLGGDLPAPGVPKLPDPLISHQGCNYIVRYDVPRLLYWTLSRIEEIGRTDLDRHDRFSAHSSHAHRHGYLHRPVVDEWLDILGQIIKRQWPQIPLKIHRFRVIATHDVDQPSLYAFKPMTHVLRGMAFQLLKRRNLRNSLVAPYIKIATRQKLLAIDPFNTFNWIMDVSDSNNLRSAFYFVCGKTDRMYDPYYDVGHDAIRTLIRQVHERGHEIGLHFSYNTYKNESLVKHEVDRLKRILMEEGIDQPHFGSRMHFLRWETASTARILDDALMQYDTTLGYADTPGFRCGTCHEYPMFDVISQQALRLRQRPLILMEYSVLGPHYLGHGYSDESLNLMLDYKKFCKLVGGSFTFLWHNSHLATESDTVFYRTLVGCD